jgi:hypothetical protein
LKEFIQTGIQITGSSVIDYHNIETIKLLSELLYIGEPLNNIQAIPVISVFNLKKKESNKF